MIKYRDLDLSVMAEVGRLLSVQRCSLSAAAIFNPSDSDVGS